MSAARATTADARPKAAASTAFRTLLLSEAVSLIGDRLVALVLVSLVYERTGSAGWVAALVLAKAVPAVLLGSVAGAIADRWPRKWVMVGSNLTQGLLVLTMPWLSSTAVIIAVYFAMSVVNQCFVPARTATIPDLVAPDELASANSKFAAAFVLALAVGPALGGLLTEAFGHGPVFVIDALTFLVPAVAVARLTLPATARSHTPTLWADTLNGWRWVGREPGLVRALLGTTAGYLVIGTLSVTGVVIARQAFHTGDAGFGLMMSALGAGMLAGAILVARRSTPTFAQGAGRGLLLAGCATVALAWLTQLPLALLVSIFIGFGLIRTQILATMTLQSVPAALRGRALGLMQVATGVAQIAATAMSAWGTTAHGSTLVLMVAGLAAAAMGLRLLTIKEQP